MIKFSEQRQFSFEPNESLSGLLILYLRIKSKSKNCVLSHILFTMLIRNWSTPDKENIPKEIPISISSTNTRSKHQNKKPIDIEKHRGNFTILEKAIKNNNLVNLDNNIQPLIKTEIISNQLIEKQSISQKFTVGRNVKTLLEIEIEIERNLESRYLSSIRFHLKEGQSFSNDFQVLGDYFIDANSLHANHKQEKSSTYRFFKSENNFESVKTVINLVKKEINKKEKGNAGNISLSSNRTKSFEISDSVLTDQSGEAHYNSDKGLKEGDSKKENRSQEIGDSHLPTTSTPMKRNNQPTPPEPSLMSDESTSMSTLVIFSDLQSSTGGKKSSNDTTINNWNEKTIKEKFPDDLKERRFERNTDENWYQITSPKMFWPLIILFLLVFLITTILYTTSLKIESNNKEESEKAP